jgi:hypothetical protein
MSVAEFVDITWVGIKLKMATIAIVWSRRQRRLRRRRLCRRTAASAVELSCWLDTGGMGGATGNRLDRG